MVGHRHRILPERENPRPRSGYLIPVTPLCMVRDGVQCALLDSSFTRDDLAVLFSKDIYRRSGKTASINSTGITGLR